MWALCASSIGVELFCSEGEQVLRGDGLPQVVRYDQCSKLVIGLVGRLRLCDLMHDFNAAAAPEDEEHVVVACMTSISVHCSAPSSGLTTATRPLGRVGYQIGELAVCRHSAAGA